MSKDFWLGYSVGVGFLFTIFAINHALHIFRQRKLRKECDRMFHEFVKHVALNNSLKVPDPFTQIKLPEA